jgi:hypothetical protein
MLGEWYLGKTEENSVRVSGREWRSIVIKLMRLTIIL